MVRVSLTDVSVKPKFRTISKVHENDYDFRVDKGLFIICRTSNGCVTPESTAVYLNSIVKLYFEQFVFIPTAGQR
jgi:hypothetical protein